MSLKYNVDYQMAKIAGRGIIIKKFTKKRILHFILTSIIVIVILGIITYITFSPGMPDDGKHKDLSSNFVCLGCHNNARNGGSSIMFHFDRQKCVRCHV